VTQWRMIDGVRAFERRMRMLDQIAPPRGIRLPRDILDCVPALTPGFMRPEVMAPLAEILERAPRGRLRVAFHGPPRFGKTEVWMAAAAKWLRDDPRLAIMLGAHTAGLALSKSARTRDLSMLAGVRIDHASRAKSEWLTTSGGGLRAFGFDSGAATGQGSDILLIDDPFAGMVEALSQALRDKRWDMFRSTLLPRLEPDGSCIIIAQRFHEDDLTGRAIRELGFEYVAVTPRDEAGRSRWPERWPDEVLDEIEVERGRWIWAAQYEGKPIPRDGEQLFVEATTCSLDEIPDEGLDAIGLDLAHSAKSRSDPHAAVGMRRVGDRYWIVEMRSRVAPLTREEAHGRKVPGFTDDVRAMQLRMPRAQLHMYAGGNAEPLVLTLLSKLPVDERIHVRCMRAGADKHMRAQPLAAAWRAGKVYVPRDASWADRLIAHFAQFTGEPNGSDDIVDAAAAAFDALAKVGGPRGRARGTGDGSVRDKFGGVTAA
jgi:predicted phage terminase large subunit-like protein